MILLSALPCLPVEQAEQVFTVAVCHSHKTSSSAKHTKSCCRPHHHTRQDLLSWDFRHTSCLHPQLLSRLKDLGVARNVPNKPRRKQRKISLIVGVHKQLPAGQARPSPHQPHSSLCSLKESISVSTTPITPDETKSVACSHQHQCKET